MRLSSPRGGSHGAVHGRPSRANPALLAILAALVAVASVVLPLAAAGCGSAQTAEEGTLRVAVSVPPQKYFVERIAGDLVEVTMMVEPGVEPHTYEPKPAELKELSAAAVYFTIGLPFETTWMDRFRSAAPNMEVVDTTAAIERLLLPKHSHEHEGEADEHEGDDDGDLDPHVWTSPALVKMQAEVITSTLSRIDPAHAADYERNLATFLADIDALDTELRAALQDHAGAKFIVYHPAWSYFARDYGLVQVPVEIDGQEPSAAALASLIREAEEEGIRIVFVQPEFSTRSAETIAKEIGGSVIPISPLEEDWLKNMRQVAESLAEVLQQQ